MKIDVDEEMKITHNFFPNLDMDKVVEEAINVDQMNKLKLLCPLQQYEYLLTYLIKT